METLRRQFARAGCVGSAIVLAVAGWLGFVSMARSQVTSAELKLLDKLLAEPDGKPAFDKRLRLIADALERLGDPKRRLRSSYGIDMRRARIPAEEGVPFLLKFLDHQAEVTKRAAMHMLGGYGREARPAVPKLRRLLDDPLRYVQEDAMLTLARIEPDNREIAMTILDRRGPWCRCFPRLDEPRDHRGLDPDGLGRSGIGRPAHRRLSGTSLDGGVHSRT